MATKEQLQGLLTMLHDRRETLLNQYLADVGVSEWTNERSMEAVNSAGRLHDIDRHITNITMEMNRIAPMQGEASNG